MPAMPEAVLDEAQLRRLLRAGRSLVAHLDLEAVLYERLATAREITGARYAALGVLDERRHGLARFLTSGIDAATHRAIGAFRSGDRRRTVRRNPQRYRCGADVR